MKNRPPLRSGHTAPVLPDDERVLNAMYSTLHLQWRCDLALWYALYDEALRQVARVTNARDRKIRAYAEHVLARGGEEAKEYIRAARERAREEALDVQPTTKRTKRIKAGRILQSEDEARPRVAGGKR